MVSESLIRLCLTSSFSSRDSLSIPVSSEILFLMMLEMTASQSFPPRNLSPSVATAVNDVPSISRTVTSNVPPPRSYTSTLFFPSGAFPNPKEMAAAVGSLMTVTSSRPAMVPAVFVASLSFCPKYAGHVMTAFFTSHPWLSLKSLIIFLRMTAESMMGLNSCPSMSTV